MSEYSIADDITVPLLTEVSDDILPIDVIQPKLSSQINNIITVNEPEENQKSGIFIPGPQGDEVEEPDQLYDDTEAEVAALFDIVKDAKIEFSNHLYVAKIPSADITTADPIPDDETTDNVDESSSFIVNKEILGQTVALPVMDTKKLAGLDGPVSTAVVLPRPKSTILPAYVQGSFSSGSSGGGTGGGGYSPLIPPFPADGDEGWVLIMGPDGPMWAPPGAATGDGTVMLVSGANGITITGTPSSMPVVNLSQAVLDQLASIMTAADVNNLLANYATLTYVNNTFATITQLNAETTARQQADELINDWLAGTHTFTWPEAGASTAPTNAADALPTIDTYFNPANPLPQTITTLTLASFANVGDQWLSPGKSVFYDSKGNIAVFIGPATTPIRLDGTTPGYPSTTQLQFQIKTIIPEGSTGYERAYYTPINMPNTVDTNGNPNGIATNVVPDGTWFPPITDITAQLPVGTVIFGRNNSAGLVTRNSGGTIDVTVRVLGGTGGGGTGTVQSVSVNAGTPSTPDASGNVDLTIATSQAPINSLNTSNGSGGWLASGVNVTLTHDEYNNPIRMIRAGTPLTDQIYIESQIWEGTPVNSTIETDFTARGITLYPNAGDQTGAGADWDKYVWLQHYGVQTAGTYEGGGFSLNAEADSDLGFYTKVSQFKLGTAEVENDGTTTAFISNSTNTDIAANNKSLITKSYADANYGSGIQSNTIPRNELMYYDDYKVLEDAGTLDPTVVYDVIGHPADTGDDATPHTVVTSDDGSVTVVQELNGFDLSVPAPVTVESTDASVTVTPTTTGYDLSVESVVPDISDVVAVVPEAKAVTTFIWLPNQDAYDALVTAGLVQPASTTGTMYIIGGEVVAP